MSDDSRLLALACSNDLKSVVLSYRSGTSVGAPASCDEASESVVLDHSAVADLIWNQIVNCQQQAAQLEIRSFRGDDITDADLTALNACADQVADRATP